MNYELTECLPWIFIGIALLLSLLTIFGFERPLLYVGSYREKEEIDNYKRTPKVSVIVYSQVAEEELLNYLSSLCEQDYPDFEVIVVCESTAEGSDMLTESCTRHFKNVYVTFIPPGSHNLSRKKLALTLGMKAAKGDIVITTVANARIHSGSWLSALIAPFRGDNAETVDVSLGYSHFDYSQMKGLGKWYREFVAQLTDAGWIGYAISGNPYRGDGNNLAFRRKLFFEHKGYSQSIYLHSGDDDLFINEIATPENTVMVLEPQSILSTEWGDASKRMWRARKEQYDFTSHWLPRGAFLKAGAASATRWVILLMCIAAGLTGYIFSEKQNDINSFIPAIAAIGLLLIFQLSEILIYRKAAEKMKATRLWWALPIFRLARPVLNFLFRLRHRRHRRYNYTWMR